MPRIRGRLESITAQLDSRPLVKLPPPWSLSNLVEPADATAVQEAVVKLSEYRSADDSR